MIPLKIENKLKPVTLPSISTIGIAGISEYERSKETIMDREMRDAIIKAVDKVAGLRGMAETIADHLIMEGFKNVTFESLTFLRHRPEGADRDKVVTPAAAKKILAAIEFCQAFIREPKRQPKSIRKFLENTTKEEFRDLADKSASMRINYETKPPSWRKIREELGLSQNEFHDIIRKSKDYRDIVEKILKERLDSGWFFEGDLIKLTGIDLDIELSEKNKQNTESFYNSETE